jgi:uncharacterized protein (TIGR03067 family)
MRFSLCTLLIVLAIVADAPGLGQTQPDPGEALYGEWEVVEMVYRGKEQDFKGRPGGWFVFEPGRYMRHFRQEHRNEVMPERVKKVMMWRCAIRQREIDIWLKRFPAHPPGAPGGEEVLLKALYDLSDGKLRIVWTVGERPTDFDEAYKDPALTSFVLKKVK